MRAETKVYYNPLAGAGNATKLWKQVQDLLHDEVCVPEAHILVIGGDGTFNRLLNELPHPEGYRFILLAGGTSNSLYSQLTPHEAPIAKLQRFLHTAEPVFQSLDVPELTVHGATYRFINEASVGFAAAIAREIEQRQTKHFFNRLKLNELAYITTAFRCWRKELPYMLSLCNNRRISGNLIPCVNADFSDGLIDCFELSCPRIRLPFELTRLVNARIDKPSKHVSRQQKAQAEWHFEQPLPVEIDGNPLPQAQDIRLSLYPKKIQVF